MKRRNPIHAYKRLLAKDYDWDYAYLIALEKKKLQRMHDCITLSGNTSCWDGGTKVSPPSTPHNRAYYTAHPRSHNANFDENFLHPLEITPSAASANLERSASCRG